MAVGVSDTRSTNGECVSSVEFHKFHKFHTRPQTSLDGPPGRSVQLARLQVSHCDSGGGMNMQTLCMQPW